MLKIVALIVLVVPGFFQGRGTGEVARTPRLAAVRFALANDFEIPRAGVVVAAEAGFERGKARQTTRSASDLSQEAQEIARLVGGQAVVGRASELLTCPATSTCVASSNKIVLVVEDPYPEDGRGIHPGGPDIYIKLFFPATPGNPSSLQHAVVITAPQAGGWVATGYDPRFPPKKRFIR